MFALQILINEIKFDKFDKFNNGNKYLQSVWLLALQRPPADESSELLYSNLWMTYDGLKQLQNSLYFSFYM